MQLNSEHVKRYSGPWPVPLWQWSLAALFGLSYLVLFPPLPVMVSLLLKAGITLPLAFITLRTLQDSAGFLLITALLSAMVGDILNTLQMYNLSAIAFMLYMASLIILFIRHRFSRPLSLWRIALSIVIALHCFLLAAIVLSNMNAGIFSAFAYILLLMIFGFSACMTHWDDPTATIGTVFFMVTSTIMGLHVYLGVTTISKDVALTFYIAGQILITYGVLKAKRG